MASPVLVDAARPYLSGGEGQRALAAAPSAGLLGDDRSCHSGQP